MQSPNFASLSQVEEELLLARLAAVRHSIAHAGEKGRALEHHVRQFLRDLLPQEYGLTTGFVAWLSPNGPVLSPQLDIIIYDAIRHSPLIHLETCDVLPLEAVYGYVEVKASIRSNKRTKSADDSIESCIRTNAAIRKMRYRAFHVPLGGSPMESETQSRHWLAMRAYVVAFESRGKIAKNAGHFAQTMAEALQKESEAHIHGVLIPNHGFFYTRAINPATASDDDRHHVVYTTDHPLLAFKALLLKGLATFERPPGDWTPAIDQYFEHNPQWKERTPSRTA
jgi:hypothetical protein